MALPYYAALYGGDDVWVRGRGDMIDPTVAREGLGFVWEATRGMRPGHLRAFATATAQARRATAEGARADCEVGARMANRFGLEPGIELGLRQIFERWDGQGSPLGLIGHEIALAARFAAVAYAFVMFASVDPDAAGALVSRWAGRGLDPDIAAHAVDHADRAIEVAGQDDAWLAVVAAEPGPIRRTSQRGLDEVARGFADAVDLKSPFMHGHSSGVAALSETAAAALGLDAVEVATVRRAGLLHDLGRAGIPTGIWEKPGPLSTAEWEQVRLHPYHTERIHGRALPGPDRGPTPSTRAAPRTGGPDARDRTARPGRRARRDRGSRADGPSQHGSVGRHHRS
jgi:hypothetical protein